jgi:hypothetical protein
VGDVSDDGARKLERRVVAEDRGLETVQRFARVEAERLDECRACILISRESIGLPTGAVERVVI